MFATNGSIIPTRNHGQNFLPKFTAINPAINGRKNGKRINGIAATTSMMFVVGKNFLYGPSLDDVQEIILILLSFS